MRSKVHLLYRDEKPLIEKLGSGTMNAAGALLGNSEALQLYSNVMNENLSEMLCRIANRYIRKIRGTIHICTEKK